MKLINYTYSYVYKWLIVIGLIGSLFCYGMIEYINHEETDEFLTYEMERLVRYYNENRDLPEFNNVAGILYDTRYDTPYYKDTLLLEPGDNEMVPYRELRFSIVHKEQDITIVLRHLLLGEDDIIEGTFLIVGGIILLMALVFFFIVRYVNKEIWKPFYETLDKLKRFKVTEPAPVFRETEIDEFTMLNSTVERLFNKIHADFRQNKEFNENASHELQTHLAVIRANTEKLINQYAEEEEIPEALSKIYTSSGQLSRIQKSLLLLSKISNQEYADKQSVDLKTITEKLLEQFEETIAIRELELDTDMQSAVIRMNTGLAEILISNLLKNAIRHNTENGFISIRLRPDLLEIANSGEPAEGDPEKLFERFAKGARGNNGLGLAIVKQICDLHQLTVRYEAPEKNIHRIRIYLKPG